MVCAALLAFAASTAIVQPPLRAQYTPPAGGTVTAASKVRTFGTTFTNSGSTVSTGQSAPFRIPYACTISSWNISLAPSGTATISLWKIATGTAIPTVANNDSTLGVSIASGTSVQSSTVTDFISPAVALNDLAIASLTAVGGSPTSITYSVECDLP